MQSLVYIIHSPEIYILLHIQFCHCHSHLVTKETKCMYMYIVWAHFASLTLLLFISFSQGQTKLFYHFVCMCKCTYTHCAPYPELRNWLHWTHLQWAVSDCLNSTGGVTFPISVGIFYSLFGYHRL